MKIVLDTNVYIAAALSPRGFSQDILKQSAKDYFTIVASEEILKEIQDKLRKKFKWTEEETDRFLDQPPAFSVFTSVVVCDGFCAHLTGV